MIVPGLRRMQITAGKKLRPTFGTPQGEVDADVSPRLFGAGEDCGVTELLASHVPIDLALDPAHVGMTSLELLGGSIADLRRS